MNDIRWQVRSRARRISAWAYLLPRRSRARLLAESNRLQLGAGGLPAGGLTLELPDGSTWTVREVQGRPARQNRWFRETTPYHLLRRIPFVGTMIAWILDECFSWVEHLRVAFAIGNRARWEADQK